MSSDNQFLILLSELEDQLANPAPKGTDQFRQYTLMRPTILAVLPFIDLIPVYGKTIGKVIRLLMGVANRPVMTLQDSQVVKNSPMNKLSSTNN